jgi:hypothetical protein
MPPPQWQQLLQLLKRSRNIAGETNTNRLKIPKNVNYTDSKINALVNGYLYSVNEDSIIKQTVKRQSFCLVFACELIFFTFSFSRILDFGLFVIIVAGHRK